MKISHDKKTDGRCFEDIEADAVKIGMLQKPRTKTMGDKKSSDKRSGACHPPHE